MSIIQKQHITGSIKPRWPKRKVVKWLEWGAIPAILGLWLPDWSGGYIQQFTETTQINYSWLTFPPLIMFIGAVILFKACLEGIKNMGWHYKGVLLSGFSAIAFAGASLIFFSLTSRNSQFYGSSTLFSIVMATFFAALFFWFTIAKVAEISAETRTMKTRNFVAVFAVTGLLTGITAVILFYFNNPFFPIVIRLTVVLFTLCFGFCRFGVYCYKTQKSIGATYTTPPDEQFWI